MLGGNSGQCIIEHRQQGGGKEEAALVQVELGSVSTNFKCRWFKRSGHIGAGCRVIMQGPRSTAYEWDEVKVPLLAGSSDPGTLPLSLRSTDPRLGETKPGLQAITSTPCAQKHFTLRVS